MNCDFCRTYQTTVLYKLDLDAGGIGSFEVDRNRLGTPAPAGVRVTGYGTRILWIGGVATPNSDTNMIWQRNSKVIAAHQTRNSHGIFVDIPWFQWNTFEVDVIGVALAEIQITLVVEIDPLPNGKCSFCGGSHAQ